MHELSVCLGLLGQLEDLAAAHGAQRVLVVTLKLGPLAGIEGALLEQAFPLACHGSVAEQASLVIEMLPVKVCCLECGKESEVQTNRLLCTVCGAWKTELVSGDEMLLASVELELEDAHV